MRCRTTLSPPTALLYEVYTRLGSMCISRIVPPRVASLCGGGIGSDFGFGPHFYVLPTKCRSLFDLASRCAHLLVWLRDASHRLRRYAVA